MYIYINVHIFYAQILKFLQHEIPQNYLNYLDFKNIFVSVEMIGLTLQRCKSHFNLSINLHDAKVQHQHQYETASSKT